MDNFWLENPKILFDKEKYFKIIPTQTMTKNEQLNAISRFLLYVTILLLLFGKNKLYIIICISIFIFVIILHNSQKYNIKGRIREAEEKVLISEEKPKEDNIGVLGYGFDGQLHTPIEKQPDKKYSYKFNKEFDKYTCLKPSLDNPYMNPTLVNYDSEYNPKACNADDKKIKDSSDLCFNNGLYKNIEDLFDVHNSQRQFYTIPHNPPDQTKFAHWLYNIGPTCKDDTGKCLNYEDIRLRRELI